jgi:hypothetical protein
MTTRKPIKRDASWTLHPKERADLSEKRKADPLGQPEVKAALETLKVRKPDGSWRYCASGAKGPWEHANEQYRAAVKGLRNTPTDPEHRGELFERGSDVLLAAAVLAGLCAKHHGADVPVGVPPPRRKGGPLPDRPLEQLRAVVGFLLRSPVAQPSLIVDGGGPLFVQGSDFTCPPWTKPAAVKVWSTDEAKWAKYGAGMRVRPYKKGRVQELLPDVQVNVEGVMYDFPPWVRSELDRLRAAWTRKAALQKVFPWNATTDSTMQAVLRGSRRVMECGKILDPDKRHDYPAVPTLLALILQWPYPDDSERLLAAIRAWPTEPDDSERLLAAIREWPNLGDWEW